MYTPFHLHVSVITAEYNSKDSVIFFFFLKIDYFIIQVLL